MQSNGVYSIEAEECLNFDGTMSIPANFFAKNKQVIFYGMASAVLLSLLKWLEVCYLVSDHSFELYMGVVALVFTLLGIWLATKLARPKVRVETVIVEKEVYITRNEDLVFNEREFNKLGLSNRELEVLQLMAEGLSNQEIAGRLFVSLNTIKTHSSNLFVKLDVSRRTQAVDKARKLSLIP